MSRLILFSSFVSNYQPMQSKLPRSILTYIWQLLSVNFGFSWVYVFVTCSCRLTEGLDECHSSDSGWYSLPSSARRLQQTKVKGGGTSRRNATASRLDFPYNCTPFTCKYNKHFIGRNFTHKHKKNYITVWFPQSNTRDTKIRSLMKCNFLWQGCEN